MKKAGILIVDDEPTIVSSILHYLHRRGYSVVGTTDPEKVVALAGTNLFQLLIMDIKMEPISGIEIVKRLRQNKYMGEIIFMSAFAEEYREDIERLGVKIVLNKPFKMYNLVDSIERLIN